MKIKIKRLPKAQVGGVFGMPYAGMTNVSPAGLSSSDTSNLNESINDSVKPVDPEDANLEAEKGEVLFKNDATGIYKIKGKKHSQGGTPLAADPMDFIFSDQKSLAITKEEAEQFELKKSRKLKDNTPAKVIQREVDFKLYNKFVNILKDPKSDDISKRTAELMLSKYQDKIGQVAFIQESKKNFESGVPAISEGTAPAYSPEIDDAKVKSVMYAKYGGFLPIYTPGGSTTPDDKCPCGKDAAGNCLPCTEDQLKALKPKARKAGKDDVQGMTLIGSDEDSDIYHKGTDASQQPKKVVPTKGPKMTDAQWKQFLATESPEHKRKRLGMTTVPATDDLAYVPRENTTPTDLPEITLRTKTRGREPLDSLVPKNLPNVPNVPFQGFDIGMNANEALSVVSPYLIAAAQPTYYDMLQQKHTPDIRLDRVNNREEISQIQQAGSLATREGYANMDPRIAALVAGNTEADTVKQMAASNAQNVNTNIPIANQESMINFQKDMGDRDFNLAQIQEVYRHNLLSDQRTDEARANGLTDSINNMNAVQKNLDTINQGLTRSVLPYLTNAYYDKNGNYIGQGDFTDLTPEQQAAVSYSKQQSPITVNGRRMPITTGFGSLNSVKASGQEEGYQKLMSSILQDLGSSDPAIRSEARKSYILLNKPNQKNESPYDEIYGSLYKGILGI